MARITALKAYSRNKSKQTKTQTAKTKANTKKQLSSIKSGQEYSQLVNNTVFKVSARLGLAGSTSKNFDTDSISTTSSIGITGSSRKKTKKQIAQDNRKITDYYSILSRGRENYPKSPAVITPLARPISFRCVNTTLGMESLNINPTITTTSAKKKNKAEVITICDTDDEDKIVISNRLTTQKLKLPEHSINNKIKQEIQQEDSDEDVEVLEMLPPIPLRDHPVHDLED